MICRAFTNTKNARLFKLQDAISRWCPYVQNGKEAGGLVCGKGVG